MKELEDFYAAVLAIVANLPVPIEFDLVEKCVQIFEHAMGLVGLVHLWFERSLAKCLANGYESISWTLFWETRLADAQCEGIYSELVAFKTFHDKYRDVLVEAKHFLLGYAQQSTHEQGPQRLNPGTRRLVRDPVPK
jgi:hypothetical protein